MGRRRLWAVIVSATALGALALPAGALAGTYTWSMPSDFTATAPGANPDHDAYGAAPWSYVDASAADGGPLTPPTPAPAAFRLLGSFAGAKWSDALDASKPFVARNGSAGRLELQPASDRVVAVGWTSPLSHAATVSVTGTFARLGGASCLLNAATWALVQDGASIAGGSGATIAATATVPAGGTIYLAIDYMGGSLGYNAGCSTAGVTLQLRAVDSTAPVVTLASPAAGALVGSVPTFSGSAGNGFGASRTVTVRVYAGSGASGAPVQTLTATRSGSVYLVGASSSLPDGTYTATAEQDSLGSPPDAGRSAPTTFTVKAAAGASQVTIDQPPAGGSTSDPTPLLAGAAGTDPGDSPRVTVTLYAGGFATGKPLGTASATASGGRWSLRWPTALVPGIYTAVATQPDGSGHTNSSGPHSFLVLPGRSTTTAIGSTVAVNRRGIASISISCPAGAGHGCTGNILILTARSFRAVAGGPAGPLRVMFAYVTVPAGRTVAVRRRVQPSVLRVLRRAHGLKVRVVTNFGATSTVTRALKITR